MTPKPVGILGGTFDPVHRGHLHLANEVRRFLDLPRVLMLLSARPPHKRVADLAPLEDREAMLRTAVRDYPALEVETVELSRPEIGYTIDTLRWFRDGPRSVVPLFILGMDSLVEIPTWRDWRELIAEFDLVVVDRFHGVDAGDLAPDVLERLVDLTREEIVLDRHEPGRGGRIFRLPIEPIPVSSSEIRARAADGRWMGDLVTPDVARYIQSHGLYLEEKRRSRP